MDEEKIHDRIEKYETPGLFRKGPAELPKINDKLSKKQHSALVGLLYSTMAILFISLLYVLGYLVPILKVVQNNLAYQVCYRAGMSYYIPMMACYDNIFAIIAFGLFMILGYPMIVAKLLRRSGLAWWEYEHDE